MDDAARLRELLVQALPIYERFDELSGLDPTEGSAALFDATLPNGELVRASAMLAMSSSIDHLMTWAKVYVDGHLQPTHAHFTLLRSVVEAASTARWLVDPTVTAEERVRRGIGRTLEDLRERRKLEQMPAADGSVAQMPTGQSALERIDALTRQAAHAGLEPEYMGHTRQVTLFGLGEMAYRVLCAFAHATSSITFAMSSREEAREPDAGRLQAVRVSGDSATAAQFTQRAIDLVRLAATETFGYLGHRFYATPVGERRAHGPSPTPL